METVKKSNRESMWRSLIPESLAESLLERAEKLSLEGKIYGSIRALKQAAKLFAEIERFLEVRDWEVEDPHELELIKKIREDAKLKRKYCLAKIAMEKKRLENKVV